MCIRDSCCCDTNVSIPTNICSCYGEDLVIANNIKKVLVSLGLFTIVRICLLYTSSRPAPIGSPSSENAV